METLLHINHGSDDAKIPPLMASSLILSRKHRTPTITRWNTVALFSLVNHFDILYEDSNFQ